MNMYIPALQCTGLKTILRGKPAKPHQSNPSWTNLWAADMLIMSEKGSSVVSDESDGLFSPVNQL